MINVDQPFMQLYEVQLAQLVPIDDEGDERRQRYFRTSEQLIAYLAGAPRRKVLFVRRASGQWRAGLADHRFGRREMKLSTSPKKPIRQTTAGRWIEGTGGVAYSSGLLAGQLLPMTHLQSRHLKGCSA